MPTLPTPILIVTPRTEPCLRRDIGPLLLCLALPFVLGIGLHLLDYPKWDEARFRVSGEYIQATHDAYHWLAGALGIGKATGTPLALLVRALHRMTGAPLGDVAFFSPMFTAGLAGSVVALLAWTLGSLEAGLLAGVFTVAAPGFFYRTRLGYYDTDMVTLLLPLLLCWGMAHWMRPCLHADWWTGLRALRKHVAPDAAQPRFLKPTTALSLLLFGVFARYCGAWHEHIHIFGMLLYCMALIMVLLLSRPGTKGYLLLGLSIFGLSAHMGNSGLGAAIAVIALICTARPSLRSRLHTLWPAALLAGAVLLFAGLPQELWHGGRMLLDNYLKQETQASTDADTSANVPPQTPGRIAVSYPSVVQSIVEAQNIDINNLLVRVHPVRWLGILGLCGFVGLLFINPLSFFLLPLFILGLSSVALGGRMSMFAAPIAGLGLALPLCMLGRISLDFLPQGSSQWKRPILVSCMLLLSIAVIIPPTRIYALLVPTPVLDKAHAQALLHLREIAPEDATVWTWWDWGYPTQYYSRRRSFADGGRQQGHHVFTLGLVMQTPSALQAAQVIKFSALQYNEPWTLWNTQPADQVQFFLNTLKTQNFHFPTPKKQYLVVSIDNFRLMHWISYYGSWDLVRRQGHHARVVRLSQTFDLDYEAGTITFPADGNTMQLSSMDVIFENELHHYDYPNNRQERHLVLEDSGEHFFLMNSAAYRSQAVQLLLCAPDDKTVARNFKLVHNGFPSVRIYEVR